MADAKTVGMSKVAVVSLVSVLFAASTQLASAQPGAPAAPGTPATVIIIDPGAPPPPGMAQPPGMVQPGVVPAQPAPQNEDWNNVSHINGTPVPVGERNDYLYKFRRTIISANPIAWMFDVYGVSLSVALSDNIALHGDVTLYSGDFSDATELSVGVPIYFRRTFQGPFIEPGVLTRSSSDGDDDTGPQVLLGWHWMYESGWNLAVAFGAGRDVTQDDPDYSSDEPFPTGYIRVGYGF